MGTRVNIKRVYALPDQLEANTLYFVARPDTINDLCGYGFTPDIGVYLCSYAIVDYHYAGYFPYQEVNETLVDLYAVGNDPNDVRHIISEAEIDNKITTAVDTAVSDLSKVEVVPDISARDALPKDKNKFVLVLDASADPTVAAGSATYVLDINYVDPASGQNTPRWSKVSETESLDMVVTWALIEGTPVSTPAEIDDLVGKAHTHSNKTVLDGLNDQSGLLLYNTNMVSTAVITEEW